MIKNSKIKEKIKSVIKNENNLTERNNKPIVRFSKNVNA